MSVPQQLAPYDFRQNLIVDRDNPILVMKAWRDHLTERAGYREVMERMDWDAVGRSSCLEKVMIFSPSCGGGEGARGKVPKALGKAMVAFLDGGLDPRAVGGNQFEGLMLEAKVLYRRNAAR